jgi:hypothetical protein
MSSIKPLEVTSENSDFLGYISDRFKKFTTLIDLKNGEDSCECGVKECTVKSSCKNCEVKTQQRFNMFKYQEFLYNYMKAHSKLPEDSANSRGILVYHGMGSGKCHQKDTPILMYDGSIKMVQNVEVGDEIMGDDSTPRKVLSLGRGEDTMYEINPIKGEPFTVNSEHILCLKTSNHGIRKYVDKRAKNKKEKFLVEYINKERIKKTQKSFDSYKEAEKFLSEQNKDNVIEISVNEYLKLSTSVKNNLKIYRTGVDFENTNVDFDPYIIGFWIGDGSKTSTRISSQDSCVLHYLHNTLPKYNLDIVYVSQYDYDITRINRNKPNNKMMNALRKYNLINNKHIPKEYKINSREVRLQVLAGLLDSDGHLSRGCFEFVQKNENIADDVLFLARSLGFCAYKKEKKTSWTYKGVKKYGNAYRIIISGNIDEIPTKIPRKQATPRKQKKDVLVTGFEVVQKPRDNYYGFTLDRNHRYVMGDFTVTHNTISGILLADAARKYNLKQNRNEDFETKKEYERKVIIMIPANLLHDPWVKELSNICISDCNLKEKLEAYAKTAKSSKDIKEFLKGFDHYVIHYNSNNLVGGWKDQLGEVPTRNNSYGKYHNMYSERDNPFDDSVIIIDEVHNVLNSFSNELEKQSGSKIQMYYDIMDAKNCKLICLSGTPMINKSVDLAFLFNMLRGQIKGNDKIRFELDNEHFEKLFFNGGIIRNPNLFRRRINGLVSYYTGVDDKVFARKIIDKVLVPLSSKQSDGYMNAFENERKLFFDSKATSESVLSYKLNTIKSSNAVFPSYCFEPDEQKRLKLKKDGKIIPLSVAQKNIIKGNVFHSIPKPGQENEEAVLTILDNDSKPLHVENNLSDISKKMYLIIRKIKEANGPVIVYSRFEGIYGIRLFAEVLKQNGFEDYDENGKKTGQQQQKKYDDNKREFNGTFIKWTGKHRDEESKKVFNSLENSDGSLIKVFCMTSVGKEGISLMSIRQIHLLEPWWNNIIERQVIGRGVRICSHNHIPEADFKDVRLNVNQRTHGVRLVNVFKYYSYVMNKRRLPKNMPKYEVARIRKEEIAQMKKTSTDHYIMSVAEDKEKRELQLLKLMKDVAIDCEINKNINKDAEQVCFVSNQYANYFSTWFVEDNLFKLKKKYRMITYKNINYWVDQERNVYERSSVEGNITAVDNSHGYKKIGVLNPLNEVIFDSNYIPLNKRKISELKNIFSELSVMDVDFSKSTVLDLSNMSKYSPLLLRLFKFSTVLKYDDLSDNSNFELLTNYANSKIISGDIQKVFDSNVKYDFSFIHPESIEVSEHDINILMTKSKYILLSSIKNIDKNLLLNKVSHIGSVYVIDNTVDYKNDLIDLIKTNFKSQEVASTVFMTLVNNNIKTMTKLKNVIKIDNLDMRLSNLPIEYVIAIEKHFKVNKIYIEENLSKFLIFISKNLNNKKLYRSILDIALENNISSYDNLRKKPELLKGFMSDTQIASQFSLFNSFSN